MLTRRAMRIFLVVSTFAAVALLGKFHAARNGYDFTGSDRFAWTVAYGALLSIASYAMGLPDVVRPGRMAFGRAVAASLFGAVAISVVQLLLGDTLLPRLVVFGALPILVPVSIATATFASRGHDRAGARDRVFLVGNATDASLLQDDIEMAPERPASLVGTVDPEVAAAPGQPLVTLVSQTTASVVVLARDAQIDDAIVHQAAQLHESGLRIRSLSLFYEQWLAKLPVSELERVSLFFDIGELHRARYARASRVMDVAVSILALPVLVLVVPIVILGNLTANRGPLFYRQPRVGKNGVIFEILKFRTMRAPRDGRLLNEWTTEDDPRITAFGRILRRTHLDELPQVLNILRGDLSVVGPRPEQPHYVEELVSKLPFYALRHLVRPGLTGWAQVKYGYAGTERDALEKLQYDFFYLRHQSLAMDLRVIVRTVRSVVGARGR